MLVYPTIKEAPIAGLSGFGGGASGLVQGASAKVWTEGTAADWNFIEFLGNSPYNYDTSGNSGVGIATIDENALDSAEANNQGWCMAISLGTLDTDRPTNVLFRMNAYSDYGWFGLGLLLPNNTAFNTVIRSQSGQQGPFWQVSDGNAYNTNSAVNSISGLSTTVAQDTVCKLIVNPLDTEQNGVAAGSIAVYIGSTLDQTVTMTSDFISHIENGEVHATTDSYQNGKWWLQRQQYS